MSETVAKHDLDEQHLRGWIGREQVAFDMVTADLAHKFAMTFDRSQDVAHGAAVMRLLHFCLAQPAAPTSTLGEDGHPARGDFLPPVSLPRRMWAGGKLSFAGELHIGDTVRRTSRIADVTMKQGRSGRLCFVAVDHVIEVDGRELISERQDLVYRAITWSAVAKAHDPAPRGAHVRSVDLSTPLLFRYSALTFNGHRIHYDQPYATQVECYPGLVVHGPLQATLLVDFATAIHGRPPSRFSYRGLTPLFAGEPAQLHARENDGRLELWTARTGGPVAMSAEAEWDP
ncbi:MAG: MaoC family dehydratase N-terminal domain-containing protein [Rhizobiaceae bacterium]|nr:MaoC family dehydratase N-terminal domain-containing protein [Rhizobiaceae bacterium]